MKYILCLISKPKSKPAGPLGRRLEDHPIVYWWKQKIGTWIAKEVLGFDDAVKGKRLYFLTDFPDNYILFQQNKGPRDNPRTDAYLESGGGRVPHFRSPKEFNEHARYLLQRKNLDGRRPLCLCQYCRKRRQVLRRKLNVKEKRPLWLNFPIMTFRVPDF